MRSDWGDLLREVDQPPVWSTQVSLVRGSMWVMGQAWRTRRMDVKLWTGTGIGAGVGDDAARQIWEGLVGEMLGGLDWTKDVRVTTVAEESGSSFSERWRCVIQVEDGRQLEPVINLLARFKERWEG